MVPLLISKNSSSLLILIHSYKSDVKNVDSIIVRLGEENKLNPEETNLID